MQILSRPRKTSRGCRPSRSVGKATRAREIRDGLWPDPPGYGEQHAAKVAGSTWEIRLGRGVATLMSAVGRQPKAEVGEAHGTDEAGNDGGGTRPYFWVFGKRARVWGLT